MNLKIYVMTHKRFEPPKDSMYVPMQVGCALNKRLGYAGDDTGDNISLKNKYYAELSGMYWMWKNDKTSDYIGLCHYRRYLIGDDNRTFSHREYEELLGRYDIIATKKVILENSYYDGFAASHNIRDLKAAGDVIKEKYPGYYDCFCNLVHENKTYFGNIFVTSKKFFDAYAGWLFDIFFEAEKRIDVEDYDDYQKRVFGFISEFLQYVWITVNKLSVYECRVGIIGEKFETGEVKRVIADYFKNADIDGAKDYFTSVLKKRPDLLMEASDVNDELSTAMQIISTADFERSGGIQNVLEKCSDFDELVRLFKRLNSAVSGNGSDEIYSDSRISKEAVIVAGKIYDGLKVSNRRWGAAYDKD